MLNITITGTVFDENEVSIDAWYDVYYVRQQKPFQ